MIRAHYLIWVSACLGAICGGALFTGLIDVACADAKQEGRTEVLMELPITVLTHIKVRNKDI